MEEITQQQTNASITRKICHLLEQLSPMQDASGFSISPQEIHIQGFGRSGMLNVYFEHNIKSLAVHFCDDEPWVDFKNLILIAPQNKIIESVKWKKPPPKVLLPIPHLTTNLFGEIQHTGGAWGIMQCMKKNWIARDGGAVITEQWDPQDPKSAFNGPSTLPANEVFEARSHFGKIVKNSLDDNEFLQHAQLESQSAHEAVTDAYNRERFLEILKHLHPSLIRMPESLCIKRYDGLAVLLSIISRRLYPILVAKL